MTVDRRAPNPVSGPLAGVKILDLTSVIMGPFATQILAELGADVIKVESAEGDTIRQLGPSRSAGMSPVFIHANQGKRSVVLDLKSPEGRDAALALAAQSDVLISNIRPNALRRLGLDYESVRQHNSKIIHVSCCGFDQEGPYASRPAYDDLIQGAAGIPWLMLQYGVERPCYTPVSLADRVAGLHAVYAVTTALYARAVRGEGQAVIVPMFEAMAQFVLGDHLGGLTFEPPIGPPAYSRLISPHRRPYQTKDGWLCVLAYTDRHWQSFFRAIGESNLMAEDARFTTYAARAQNIDAVYEHVAEVMLTRTSAVWQALLDAIDIPNMPMNTPQELLDDPHLRATGFIREVDHPTEGRLHVTRNPTRWSGTPTPEFVAPAPRLGEHTQEVLEALRLDPKTHVAANSDPRDG
jgi:crotonobetainyl-CoA:carnitine CoA-transferase CaiB-like acyl-CoA transferase